MHQPQPRPGQRPDVSIVIPVFNGAAWIERSVRSALEQQGVTLEVLVVDDGSNDGTNEILARLARGEPRLRLLRTSQRSGPGAARNVALDCARGDWIAFLDADDRFHPGRLRLLLEVAVREHADLVADNQRVVTEEGDFDGVLLPRLTAPTWVDALAWVEHNVWFGPDRFGYGYTQPLVRREAIEQPRLRMRPELRLLEDYHFVLALLRRGHRLLLWPEALYDYTQRASSSTHATAEQALRAVLRAGDEVIAEVGPGPLREALRRQQASVRWRATRAEVIRGLKARRWGESLRLLAREPAAVPYVLRTLREAVARRVRSRRHRAESHHA